MNTFGQKLRDARKAKNLTQKQLAEQLGAKHNSISNWENDQNKPDPDMIELICGVLNIEPNYLLSKDSSVNNRSNLTEIVNPSQSKIDLKLQMILHKYESLDEKGKHTVDTILEMEYNRCKKTHLLPNAAHEIKGTSEADKLLDEDIMDNDDFWK
ncbi:helix-turn-helix domain-containing protein [Anaerocolumna sp. AGMB13025]|uniref:helix-turn-helix domain-containing protein n=1 Tax=Anaerocolumna sp. AGMB13025 TaxID=3039116 RepID=UPI00241C1DBF|nr:helix-turn-helix domain-containing protein [Anaerocolumna sp. AGMB13025]WFR56426.1 helix-turn-helix domain-containing protein [Anaerocolumna sp. AGMB13025]